VSPRAILAEQADSVHGALDILVSSMYVTCMNLKGEAIQVARRAESEIRTLIEKAVRGGQYQEVADLADVAQGLMELRNRLGDTTDGIGSSVGSMAVEADSLERSSKPKARKRKKSSSKAGLALKLRDTEYPRFLKDQDKLVKVGWSEREASTYEHRAPFEAIRVVVQKIEALTGKSDTFRMEDVLPVQVDGNEIPSYQAYMALAWLRKSSLVDRSNKNSYIVKSSHDLLKTVERLWKSLPTVASERKENASE
jgi:hypothetical protein